MSAQTKIADLIAAIDAGISRQLSEILHAPEVQKLEASWLGLQYLVQPSLPSEGVIVRVLSVSKRELLEDFQAAGKTSESALWHHLHDSVFGHCGVDPYSILLGDYEYDNSASDIEFLIQVSHVAAATHFPFMAAASPRLLSMRS